MLTALVRYGEMRTVAAFKAELPDLRHNDKCICHTDRGTEIGVVLTRPVEAPAEGAPEPIGQVVRRVTPEDIDRVLQIEAEHQGQEYDCCRDRIKSLALPMSLVTVEHIFGGERVIFYFLAEGRVDFRGLVKDLAKEFRTRIEMRQIGVRDEARLLGDYQNCGRELCCRGHIKEFEPISMRMAKSQTNTLDPGKISGRCGKLKCCLRYEDATYTALKANLPNRGARILTQKGAGEVYEVNILGQSVGIYTEAGERQKVMRDEIIGPDKRPKPAPRAAGERAEAGGGKGGGMGGRGGRGAPQGGGAGAPGPQRERRGEAGGRPEGVAEGAPQGGEAARTGAPPVAGVDIAAVPAGVAPGGGAPAEATAEAAGPTAAVPTVAAVAQPAAPAPASTPAAGSGPGALVPTAAASGTEAVAPPATAPAAPTGVPVAASPAPVAPPSAPAGARRGGEREGEPRAERGPRRGPESGRERGAERDRGRDRDRGARPGGSPRGPAGGPPPPPQPKPPQPAAAAASERPADAAVVPAAPRKVYHRTVKKLVPGQEPVLIVHGTGIQPVPPPEADRLAAVMAAARPPRETPMPQSQPSAPQPAPPQAPPPQAPPPQAPPPQAPPTAAAPPSSDPSSPPTAQEKPPEPPPAEGQP